MAKTVVLPEGLQNVSAQIAGSNGNSSQGTIALKHWSDAERRSRAIRRTGKIVGTIFVVSPICLFVHILIIPVVTILFFTLVFTAPLFIRLLAEDSTFFYAEGKCPYCSRALRLRPYLDTRYRHRVTVQCPECGQTAHAESAG